MRLNEKKIGGRFDKIVRRVMHPLLSSYIPIHTYVHTCILHDVRHYLIPTNPMISISTATGALAFFVVCRVAHFTKLSEFFLESTLAYYYCVQCQARLHL
jgi:hypothetical protein